MKFETYHRNKTWKRIGIGALVFGAIGTTIILNTSKAAYRNTESIKVAEGVIEYNPGDLKVMAVKLQQEAGNTNDSNYIEANDTEVPKSGYYLNEEKSYCGKNNQEGIVQKDDTVTIKYTYGGHIDYTNLEKGMKCFLYFDKIQTANDIKKLSKGLSGGVFDKPATTVEDSGVYEIPDGVYGERSYYYRGLVNDNWVQFAGMYWRIVRVNGDDTIRLIYSGTVGGANQTVSENGVTMTGEGTQITDADATTCYNNSGSNCYPYSTSDGARDNNKYVGYWYEDGNAHGTETRSYAAEKVDAWYSSNLGNQSSSITQYIDTNARYCVDRTYTTTYYRGTNYNFTTGTGTAKSVTMYSPLARNIGETGWAHKRIQTASLECPGENDIFSYTKATDGNKVMGSPAGLITSDEVLLAGGHAGTANNSYYLYTGQYYWTLSPYVFRGGSAFVFRVLVDGTLGGNYVNYSLGLRPIINLKANTIFSGSGTYEDPFVPTSLAS